MNRKENCKNLAPCVYVVQLMTIGSVPKADTSISSSTTWCKKVALVGWPSNGFDSSRVFCQFKNWLLRMLVPDQQLITNKTVELAICYVYWDKKRKRKIRKKENRKRKWWCLPDCHFHLKQVHGHHGTISNHKPDGLNRRLSHLLTNDQLRYSTKFMVITE